MRSRGAFPCVMLAALSVSNLSALAEDKAPQSTASYIPSLADMMATV
jgi:hypothetical protein